MFLRGWVWLHVIILLSLTTAVNSSEIPCTVEAADQVNGIHVVVGNCSSAGSFSIGGLYEGVWEKLTYYYPQPWHGTFITVNVDGKRYSTSLEPVDEILMDGYIVEHPRLLDGGVLSQWRLPENILVTQSLHIKKNTTVINVSVVNQGKVDHTVGVRLHIDTMLGENDGAPIYIPGDGLKTNEKSYDGPALNFPYWKAYNTPDHPTIVATGTLDPNKGLTYPDLLVIADWKKSKDTTWDYTVNTSRSILGDSAVLLYYNPVKLKPGEGRDVVTGYGNEKPVLPSYKGLFGVTEVITDRINGSYCPGENVKLSVDVLSAKTESQGKVRARIYGDGNKLLYDGLEDTGVVQPNSVNSIKFSWTVPGCESDKECETDRAFNVGVQLLDEEDKVIDEESRESLIKVRLSECGKPSAEPKWAWLLLPIIALIVLAMVTLMFFVGKIEVTKTREGNKVKIRVKNSTRKKLKGCVLEDEIPSGVEIHVSTINIKRKETKLLWEIGGLRPGEEASLEYIINYAGTLPEAKLRWDGGEKTAQTTIMEAKETKKRSNLEWTTKK